MISEFVNKLVNYINNSNKFSEQSINPILSNGFVIDTFTSYPNSITQRYINFGLVNTTCLRISVLQKKITEAEYALINDAISDYKKRRDEYFEKQVLAFLD